MELPALAELVARLALNAVDVQRLWNRAYAAETEAFELLARVEPWALGLWQGVAPSRLGIRSFEIETSVELRVSTEKAFEIKAVPLNLSHSVWRESTLRNRAALP